MKNIKIFAIALIVIASYANQSFAQETAILKTRTKSNQSNERSSSNVTPAPKEIDAYQILKTKSAQGQHIKQAILTCRVIPTETGCTIAFDNVGGITGGAVAGKKGYDYYKSMSCFSVNSSDNSVSIVSPRDAASGLPTGKRMHKPFVITKELDKSSPTLAESAAKGREASAPSISEVVVTKSGVQASQSSGMGVGKATFKEFTITKRCDGKTTKISCPDGECDIPLEDCPNGTCDLVCEWSWGLSQQGTSMNSSGSAGFSLEIKDGACTAMAIKEKPKMTQHK
jgi:type VI protein secretion system component Hcp